MYFGEADNAKIKSSFDYRCFILSHSCYQKNAYKKTNALSLLWAEWASEQPSISHTSPLSGAGPAKCSLALGLGPALSP